MFRHPSLFTLWVLPALTVGPLAAAVVFDPDVRLGGDQPFSGSVGQTEPAIAANPVDPDNLVAGFHDNFPTAGDQICRFAFTRDGGRTWMAAGATPLARDGNICADPSIAADRSGRFFYGYLDIDGRIGLSCRADLRVARSTDGGETFPFSALAVADDLCGVDKPYIAVDTWPKSRFRGTVYVSYTEFAFFEIRVVVSRDGGASWSAPVTVVPGVPDPLFVQGSLPVVGPDGTVFVFYSEYDFSSPDPGALSIKFAKSRDGGRSWSAPAAVATGLPSRGEFNLKNADPMFGAGSGHGLLANSFPAAAVTPDGTLFVAWIDFPEGTCPDTDSSASPCVNSDVRMSVSRNGGRTWSTPVKVSDETNATDQFFPWIAAHPDGRASLVWLDKRLDPENVRFDAFYTSTRDAVTFAPNVRLSSVSSDPGSTSFIGDYNGLAATGSAVFPVWNDMRLRTPAIFTARGALTP